MNHRVFDRIDAVVGEHVWNFADFATTRGSCASAATRRASSPATAAPRPPRSRCAGGGAGGRRLAGPGYACGTRGAVTGGCEQVEITFGADRAAVDRVTGSWPGSAGWAWRSPAGSTPRRSWRWRSARSGPGQVVALLGVSPSLAADERAAAHDVARYVGVPVVEVETREGDRPEYRANGPDRCFHCKDELFATIGAEVLDRHGLDRIAYGENADDVRRPDRPGARAATRHEVLRPLADAGLDKAAVRRSRGCSACRAPTSRPRRAWRRGSRTTSR